MRVAVLRRAPTGERKNTAQSSGDAKVVMAISVPNTRRRVRRAICVRNAPRAERCVRSDGAPLDRLVRSCETKEPQQTEWRMTTARKSPFVAEKVAALEARDGRRRIS